MRIVHRYLGYFLAGIMTVYALSGMTMIFRDSDFLKKEKQVTLQLEPGLPGYVLGKQMKIRDFNIISEENGIIYFGNGNYDIENGLAEYTVKQLPYVLNKMTQLHKARSQDPLFFLNIFFGASLLFFVISAFWLHLPGTSVFRKGLYFTAGGIILTLVLLFL